MRYVMATSSISQNIVISSAKSAERLLDALEQSYHNSKCISTASAKSLLADDDTTRKIMANFYSDINSMMDNL